MFGVHIPGVLKKNFDLLLQHFDHAVCAVSSCLRFVISEKNCGN